MISNQELSTNQERKSIYLYINVNDEREFNSKLLIKNKIKNVCFSFLLEKIRFKMIAY